MPGMMNDTGSMNWFERSARTAFYKDDMKFSERTGELAGIVATVLIIGFFLAHQLWHSGFFTAKFGPLETLLFYSSIAYGVVTAAMRAVLGRRNAIRPLEVAGYTLAVMFCVWFYYLFPFSFAHFGDVVPLSLGFLISWIPNLLVKVVLVLGAIGSAAAAVYVTFLYYRVRSMLNMSQASGIGKLGRTPFHQ